MSSYPTSPYRIPAARFNEVLQFPDVARSRNTAPARISGEVRHLRCHARMYRGRLARVVDHMADRAVIAQRHGDHVVEPYLWTLRRLDCAGQPDIRIDEDAVHAQPPRLMRRHSTRHLVRDRKSTR